MTGTAIAAGGTAVERLLVHAALAAPSADERAELAKLAHDVTDWAEFFALAKLNATVPLVQRRLAAEGLYELVPDAVRAEFAAVTDHIAAVNERRLAGALELLRRFDERGVRCVVLKGMLFSTEIYGDPRYKRMNDLDILIELDQVDTAIEIYRELGLFATSELLGKAPKVRSERSHHLPSFVSRDGALVVGTHWGLITPLAPYTIDYGAIWNRVRRIDFYGVPAWAMAHEDNLHHLGVHLPYYKTGVRELGDLWNLARYATDLDYDLLAGEIAKAGTESLMYHALSLSHRLVPNPAFADLVDRVRPRINRFTRYDTARKTADIHALLRSRSTHTSRIEKAYTEFNMTAQAHEKRGSFGRLWSDLLLVPAAEAERMSSLREPKALAALGARVSAPYRLTRVFQRDLGRWLFPAALAKTVVDLGAAYGAELAQRAGVRAATARPGIDEYAAELGLTRADLQAVLDSQE
ncbi:nucleotidyltransferase domain-containing protein [Nocardia amikacinitolerans]|uniref:nucleotidyltransferase domain-containing protein n=1 Tax=Nocardia amikacinitolerans TaxID=756689 RepID=UPI0020A5E038|nr:nucleotidyltransferase family protein [Nocardia amikacinitolerans]MCP2275911.1 putative nucleotidyltransferase [Nocardia amikacinitolerans]